MGTLMAASPNPMAPLLWRFNAEGWPLERIDTLTGEHHPVFTNAAEESLPPEDGGRALACPIAKVSGVEWVFGVGLLSGGGGGCPASEANDGGCPDKPVHFTYSVSCD